MPRRKRVQLCSDRYFVTGAFDNMNTGGAESAAREFDMFVA